jgi:autotransporter passenger strand-loop-strand repeat protein
MTTQTIASGPAPVSPGVTGVGDYLIVAAGGTALAATIAGGTEDLFGVDSGTTLGRQGFQGISSGGTAIATTVDDGATETLRQGGTALGAAIGLSGFQVVSSGGVASGTVLSAGGFQTVSETGLAADTTLLSGGTEVIDGYSGYGGTLHGSSTGLTVASGGQAIVSPQGVLTSATVSSGGLLLAYSGSTVSGVTVETGGTLIAAPGAIVDGASGAPIISTGIAVLSGGAVLVLPGGAVQASDATDGEDVQVFAGGSTSDVTLRAGFEVLSSGGVATGTVLDQGAVQYVFSGASAIGTVVNSGLSIVDAGGLALDTQVASGANQTIDGLAVSTTIGSGGGLYVLGSAVDAAIESGGYAFVLAGAFALGTTVGSGGTLLGSDATAEDTVVMPGGVMLLLNDEEDFGTTVESGGTLIALPGATVIEPAYEPGAVIVSGGVVTLSGAAEVVSFGSTVSGLVLGSGISGLVYSGGTAFDTTIADGGRLDIGPGGAASGGIIFAGAGGTLATGGTALPGAVIGGFASGDTIALTALSGGSPTAMLTSGNVLVVTNGITGASLRLDPSQSFAGETFTASLGADGSTTVGIAPPAVSGSVAGNAQPVDIPLYVLPEGNGTGGYRIGIEVSFDGGATYQMDVFDTGASGLYTAYDPALWSSYTATDAPPQLISYGAGDALTAIAVSTDVTLQTTDGSPLTFSDATVGLIASASDPGSFTAQGWNAQLTGGTGSGPFANGFYGDFGADLVAGNGLDSLLPQLGAGLANGFIVTLGAYPDGGTGQIGTLQIGLTQADIASYSTVIPMQGQNTAATFPQSGEPSYAQALGSGTITLSNGAESFTAPSALIYDTGAPEVDIGQGTAVTAAGVAPFLGEDGAVSDGTSVLIDAPSDTGWTLGFTAGDVRGEDRAISTAAASADSPGVVNAGLDAFFGQSVMFDVADGLLGFEPIACFAEGTRLATPDGERPVETLRLGDLVLTISGAARPIMWIGQRRLDCQRHPEPLSAQPVRVRAHAFGPDLPRRDLILSPDHALFLEAVLIPVKYLVNGDGVARLDTAAVTYHHIRLESHDIVLAEGLPAETYLETGDGWNFAQAADTVWRWEAAGYAPLLVTGPAVERVRGLLEFVRLSLKRCHPRACHADLPSWGRKEEDPGSAPG